MALTGYHAEADRLRARLVGFDEYLVKPVPYQMLNSVLAAFAPSVEQIPSADVLPFPQLKQEG